MLRTSLRVACTFGFLVILVSCSINTIAMNAVSDALTGEGSDTFSSDNDPELVAEALPFALKLYDSLLAQNPDHEGLVIATGSAYVTYANAFLQIPAEMLPFHEYEKKEKMKARAKNLYLRGRDIMLDGLERKYPGFAAALNEEEYESALAPVTQEDVPYLYWAGAGWMGAFSLDVFDLRISMTVPRAAALMDKALELDSDYSDGAIHSFYISYYGSLPPELGGDKDKARHHFERAVEIADGRLAGPYLAYAEAIALPAQDVEQFTELLNQALAIDPEADPDNRLANIIYQRKARWYLDNLEEFFNID
jgi:predicted anti-sigma-YlaC factor YlaD